MSPWYRTWPAMRMTRFLTHDRAYGKYDHGMINMCLPDPVRLLPDAGPFLYAAGGVYEQRHRTLRSCAFH